jgi:hypothetical protein
MIIATPLDLPIIKPDNWETFWDIWNTSSADLVKVKQNVDSSVTKIGDSGVWKGIDIFSAGSIQTSWSAPFVDIKETLPELYNSICKLPIRNIYRVRLIESRLDVLPHTDDGLDKWSIRAYFNYTDPEPQWYFTKPNDSLGAKYYFRLPPETNWFAYNDKHCWHATNYNPNHPKILLQIYMVDNPRMLVYNSMIKYKEHTVSL